MEETAFIWWKSLLQKRKRTFCTVFNLPDSWVTQDSSIDFDILTKVYKRVNKIKKHGNI